MPRPKKTREELREAIRLEATPEGREEPATKRQRMSRRRKLRFRLNKLEQESTTPQPKPDSAHATPGIAVPVDATNTQAPIQDGDTAPSNADHLQIPAVRVRAGEDPQGTVLQRTENGDEDLSSSVARTMAFLIEAVNHQVAESHAHESKTEDDDPDAVITRTLAREEAQFLFGDQRGHVRPESGDSRMIRRRANEHVQERIAHTEGEHEALRTHAEGLERIRHREEASAQLEVGEEAERAADVSERRRVRRGKVRHRHALANHEDFDAAVVTGENVEGGRHRLPPPAEVCPMCAAWKWIGESLIACCLDGRVQLPPLLPVPDVLRRWYGDEEFRRMIRMYNMVFALTSVGASCSGGFRPLGEDRSVQGQLGIYNLRVQGPMGHFLGSLLPRANPTTGAEELPKFAQIYIYDPDVEQRALRRRGIFADLNPVALMDFEMFLQEFNPFAREFISMGERMRELKHQGVDPVNIAFRLRANYNADRTNGAQVVPEVAAVLVEDGNAVNNRDLVLFPRSGGLLRLFETLPYYDTCQYLLLLLFGELGWTYTDEYADGRIYRKKRTMSLREHVAYRLYQKLGDQSVLFLGGRLFQQYVVDQCAKVEQERLRWIAANQKEIRADLYSGVRDAYLNEDVVQLRQDEGLVSRYNPDTGNLEHPQQGRPQHFLDQVGQRVILPASFTGGERYMYAQYQDAMAMVREYGKPDLFMTVTCNPNWEEIDGTAKKFADYLSAQDRPDIVARVWQQKLKSVLKDLDEGVLGYQIARIYVVEFQKRGLPHAHILIILADEDKPKTRQDYDRFVSAEVPDLEKNPALYETVMTSMIHGPCGEGHPNAPCMKNGKCSKGFPKELSGITHTNEDSFPVYRRRRRPDGELRFKGRAHDNATLNQWVVPYNPYFSQKYDCHINLEICSSIMAIKYLYKYVYKGADTTEVSAQAVRDEEGGSRPGRREPNEIVRFVKARYISPIEACMRLFEFPIQGKTHSVTTLNVHLPDSQYITFRPTDDPSRIVGDPVDTTLTGFFKLAASDALARTMLYQDIPKRYKWDKSKKLWIRYKQNRRTLGRLVHCSPNDLERFHLRLLLCHKPGPTSFENLRTVDGVVCETFKEAAMRSGYLDDDREWMKCLEEAAVFQMPSQLRQLFATILLYAFPADVAELWNNFYTDLSLDFARRHRDLPNRAEKVKFETLMSLHQLLTTGGKTLTDYPDLPQLSEFPHFVLASLSDNTFIRREVEGYDRRQLQQLVDTVDGLNANQRSIYDDVITAIENPRHDEDRQKLFFIDGPGGTGKSTLLNHVLAKVRLDGKIAIAVASSGIASLLLPGGRTAHSTFKIPLKPSGTSVCKIPKQSKLKEFIQSASLIVWDEAPMTHRFAFEAVDRTLRDILDNDQPFGGKVVLLSGDFRQILPVVVRGTPSDTVAACLKASELWPKFKQLHLVENMRVQRARNEEDASELAAFSEFLLQVGEGRHEIDEDLGPDFIRLPPDLIVPNPADVPQPENENADDQRPLPLSLTRVVDSMYPDSDLQDPAIATDDYYANRTILAPTNAAVQRMNEAVAGRVRGDVHVYLSVDSVADNDGPAATGFCETEFLHSVNINGIPPHRLVLKVGMPVMMMRNLNPDDGLCNGTRLRILELKAHVIRATIMTGAHNGKEVLIPRIIFITDNTTQDFPFHLRRKQFPIVPAFAMTINKAQGQTIQNMVLYLPTPCFSHGQLYVALSRVTSRGKFRALIEKPASEDENGAFTANIVFREVLQ